MVSIGHTHEDGGGGGRVVAVAPAAVTSESTARTSGPNGSIVFDNLPAGLTAASRNGAAQADNEVGSDQDGSVGNFSAGQLSVDTTRIGK